MQNDILPIILGATEGAYALAEAFFHDYGVRALILDETVPPHFEASRVLLARAVKNLSVPHILMRVLEDVYHKEHSKSLLLFPATTAFAAFLREREAALSPMFLLPHLPTPAHAEQCPRDADALALLYRAADGEIRAVFAAIAAKGAAAEPLAAVVRPMPRAVDEMLRREAEALSRGVYLFYQEGDVLVRESAPLHPLMALGYAADVSIPEWLLLETVFAKPLSPVDPDVRGLFTLFSYRRMRSFWLEDMKREVKQLKRARLCVALYGYRAERFSLSSYRHFSRLYRAFREKTAKTKK